ncbi:MAG TPA: hypothetical protein PKH77_09685 [Anaerolineae bacterium]|nr:hypothetical protein [Anaerolineae bacterium]
MTDFAEIFVLDVPVPTWTSPSYPVARNAGWCVIPTASSRARADTAGV